MTLPDEFQLHYPRHEKKPGNLYADSYGNGFDQEDDPKALEYLAQQHALIDKFVEGSLYIKFIDGDRKGSIAKVIPNTKTFGNNAAKKASIRNRYGSFNHKPYSFENERFYAIATWNGRSNKVQINLPNREIVFLPNYTGPTVWEKFDAKAAQKEILKSPDQKDIDGNILAIGDPVLYINARYGSGMTLEHGTVKEFKVSVDSKKHEIFTIVQNSDGVESKITNSHNMIFKK